MTTTFSLLRLPRLALIPVFEQMDEREIIAFSLLSKKVNNLLKIIRRLSSSFAHLMVESDHLYIIVYFGMCTIVRLSYYFYTKNVPNVDNAMLQKITFTHENIGLSASKWLERILDVTNCESLIGMDLKGSPQLDVCDTFATLSSIGKLYVFKDCSDSFAKKALEIVSPVTREITLFKIPFESREEFQSFLKSSFNYLRIQTNRFPKFKFTLDDILVTNALKVVLRQVKLSGRDISQFFTNWFQNKCNSRLEHLEFIVNEVVNETCFPEVLNAVPFPRDQERTFFHSKQLDTSSESFRGGYDIERADGKKATITFLDIWGQTCFDFYIWP